MSADPMMRGAVTGLVISIVLIVIVYGFSNRRESTEALIKSCNQTGGIYTRYGCQVIKSRND